MEKVNKICQQVVGLSHKDIAKAMNEIEGQMTETVPLNFEKQNRINNLGSKNQKVLNKLIELKTLIEK